MTPSSSNTTRRLVLAGIGLLLFGCCFWSGLLGWLFAPFSPYMANWITAYPGKAELVARAEWESGGGALSPDGRYMILSWERNGPRELFIWDLVTDTRIPIHLTMHTMCWLDAEQFAVLGGVVSAPQYFIVRAHDGAILSTTLVEFDQQTLEQQQTQIRTQLQVAQQVYLMDRLGRSGYTIIMPDGDQPLIYFLDLAGTPANHALVDSLLQDIPHTRVPDLCDYPGIDDVGLPVPLLSPDGHLIVRKSNDSEEITITDQSGRRVAAVRKGGWKVHLVGWAHDSSGVYVQFMSAGSSAAVTMPWKPIVKLSPLTPHEEVISWVSWLGGGVAVVFGLWWWGRWRRARVTG